MNDPAFYFNETPVNRTPCQKHLGMHLNERQSRAPTFQKNWVIWFIESPLKMMKNVFISS